MGRSTSRPEQTELRTNSAIFFRGVSDEESPSLAMLSLLAGGRQSLESVELEAWEQSPSRSLGREDMR
jgi:hypothetical protein